MSPLETFPIREAVAFCFLNYFLFERNKISPSHQELSSAQLLSVGMDYFLQRISFSETSVTALSENMPRSPLGPLLVEVKMLISRVSRTLAIRKERPKCFVVLTPE